MMPVETAFAVTQGGIRMHCNAMLCLKGTATRKRPNRKTERPKKEHGQRAGQEKASPPKSQDGIRHGLVARVRAEIASGAYETEEKLRVAVERLLDRLDQ